MSQRISTSRVVFSVNMHGSTVENTRSGSPQSRTQRLNQMHLRPAGEPESATASPIAAEPTLSSPDRKMSRRKPANQGKKPLELITTRAQTSPFDINNMGTEAMSSGVVPEKNWAQPSEGIRNRKDITHPGPSLVIPVLPETNEEELEEDYSVDRPFYLLSQKYFGTRY